MKTTPGTIQVYTGNGKGKTTAALGQALRAIGHGQRVLVIQFLKRLPTGERIATRYIPRLTVVPAGRTCFVRRRHPDPRDIQAAREGLRRAARALRSGCYDVVILDEINVAMDYGVVKVSDVLTMLRKRRPAVEVILTGRSAPRAICRLADLVSEVREVKHPWHRGMAQRPGVEY